MKSYYLDYKNMSLQKLKEKIKNTELLPSQKILLEKIEERFELIESKNIKNMFDLQEALKTKNKITDFAKNSGLPEDYLIVLRREVNSYQPKPRKLNGFQCIKKEIIDKLDKMGINDTAHLFDIIATKNNRINLAKELDLKYDEVSLLAKITDVSRLRYVSPNFATLLINSEYDTAERVQKADHNKLYEDLTNINKKEGYYKGNFGLKDMKFFVNDAKFIPLVIEY